MLHFFPRCTLFLQSSHSHYVTVASPFWIFRMVSVKEEKSQCRHQDLMLCAKYFLSNKGNKSRRRSKLKSKCFELWFRHLTYCSKCQLKFQERGVGVLKPYTHQVHKIKTSWLYVGIVCTDCQVSPPQSTDENKTPWISNSICWYRAKEYSDFWETKTQKACFFLRHPEQRERTFYFFSCQCGGPRKEGGGRALLVSHLLGYCSGGLLYI